MKTNKKGGTFYLMRHTLSHLIPPLIHHHCPPLLLASSSTSKPSPSTFSPTPRWTRCCYHRPACSSSASCVSCSSCVFCAFSPSCVSCSCADFLPHCHSPPLKRNLSLSSSFSSWQSPPLSSRASLRSFFLATFHPHHRTLRPLSWTSSSSLFQETRTSF